MLVKKRDGSMAERDISKIRTCVKRACDYLEDVDVDLIVNEAAAQLYDGITTSEIDRATIMSARARIVFEPNYSFVAARLLLNSIYKEVFGEHVKHRWFDKQYKEVFLRNIKSMTDSKRLDFKIIKKFDLARLADALKPERDNAFKYLGIQTLYDRYFIHIDKRRMETPQAFWMRVAMGLCYQEDDPTQRAIEAYELFSTFRYCPGTPTLFNSCTLHPQMSSCYLSTVGDSIDGIFGTIHNQARLSKYAGGLGVDWTPVRSMLAYIKGTNGESQGVCPWLKIFNDTLVAVNQGGKRKGAGCAYLETWHGDVMDFLELRRSTGDERRRTHDMHTANWIPDAFMRAVRDDLDWYLFSPSDCPKLHSTFGEAFDREYESCVLAATGGKIKNYQTLRAKDVWRKMLTMILETGHPWMTWKDPSNIRYSNQHVGVVNSSNLCTEILLHTKETTYNDDGEVDVYGETAVCNLGSVNLAAHYVNGVLNWTLLADTVHKAIRLLDNVIDINFYPTRESFNANMLNRPVGLGLMGWHDALHMSGIEFDEQWAIDFRGEVQEFISHNAIIASASLAGERGTYQTYDGSTWSKGEFPSDTYNRLMAYRGIDKTAKLHWPELEQQARDCVADNGMRNSNVMAIAPTATISYIVGCSQSIEPDFSVLFTYSTLSGEFTMINQHFVGHMKMLGLWNEDFARKVIQADGEVRDLPVPDWVKAQYKSAFDIDQLKLIDAAAAAQVWIDQGQSLNLYAATKSLKALQTMYFHAWESGLKTTYYLRTLGASKVEKSTIDARQAMTDAADVLGKQNTDEAFRTIVEGAGPKLCSIGNPNCESCQ